MTFVQHQCLGGCRTRALASKVGLFWVDEDVCTYFVVGHKERKDELLRELGRL